MNPVGLAELFGLDNEAFWERFRHTPLWRPKRPRILRSAAVAVGKRPDSACLPALLQGLEDAEPSVRAACAWALGRHDHPAAQEALRERLATESDADVRGELLAALQQRP